MKFIKEVFPLKVLDVKSLHTGIDHTVQDIDTFQGQIGAIQRAVRDFSALDEALKGAGGEALRSFYEECHQPFLYLLQQSLIDYSNTLVEIKEAVDTFEPNPNGYISQKYLEGDVEDAFDEVEKKTIELTDDANSIIESVQDIVTVDKLDETEVVENVQRGKDMTRDIVDELHILDEYGSSKLESTLDDLQIMKTYIADIEAKFKSGDLSVSNYDVKALDGVDSYHSIVDRINNREKEETETLNKKSIENMPVYEIEKAKDAELDKLGDGGKELLNMAFNDLESGDIDRQEYLNILGGGKQFDHDVESGEGEIEISVDLIEYLEENEANISKGSDVAGKTAQAGISINTLLKAYDLHSKGFKIDKYTTKGGIEKFRVSNPKLVGIQDPTNKGRNTKIYDKTYIDSEMKKNNGKTLKVASNVDIKAGAINGLKTRSGWIGEAIGVAINVKNNIMEGEPISKIGGDLGVDAGLGAISLGVAGGAAAFAVGTMGAPVLAGVAIGIGLSSVVKFAANFEFYGKSVSDRAKSGLQSGIKTVAGWFK